MEEALPEEQESFYNDNDANNGPYPTDAGIMCDRITQEMWENYSNILQQRLLEDRISEDNNDL